MQVIRDILMQAGIDTCRLQPLRAVVVEDDDDLADEPETELEQQYPLYTLPVDRGQVYDLWQQRYQLRAATRHLPVMLGNRSSMGRHWEGREAAALPIDYLKMAKAFEAEHWFDSAWHALLNNTSSLNEATLTGTWPLTTTPLLDFSPNWLDYPGDATHYIGFFPTLNSWETPAYLPLGNWNDCPSAEVHVGIQQYWQRQYGTEVIAMTFDTLVCRVARPITSQAAAMTVAKQHLLYCSDTVFQGAGTLSALAASLIGSEYWSFWWD